MKKMLSFLITVLILTSCAPKNDSDRQLKIIAQNRDIWYAPYKDAANFGEEVFFTTADFDKNGCLEIIVASCQGTGHYTYYDFFEVNSDHSSLSVCTLDFHSGDSLADIVTSEPIDVYYDKVSGTYHWLFTDYLNMGASFHYVEKRDVVLSDGSLTDTPIVCRITEYNDNSGEPSVTYNSSTNETVTNDAEFDFAVTKYFENMEKSTEQLTWHSFSEINLENTAEDELLKVLKS